jgi:dihydroxyacetone kinase
MLLKASMACNRAAPSTMGTLISSGILSVAKLMKSKTSIEEQEVITLPRIFSEGIVSRGKAELGDKTILDALVPMANAVEETFAETKDLNQSFKAGAVAAGAAAEATRGMQARIGRAKWLGKRAAEYPDAGAMLCAIIAKSLV